jgi:serine/threonine-protein kinase
MDAVPSEGEIIGGKYILRQRIGEGGMGVVFLADHASLGRKVAIKVLQPALATSDALVRRLHTEAIAACRVRHPGAVGVIDCGTTAAGTPFIAMEYVPGRMLSAVISEEEIGLARAIEIVRQLLRTLQVAHESGVVHADIKSDNILVRPAAMGDAVTLIDFGLARVEGREPEGCDFVSGTPEYMAPELVRGETPTAACDLYGVGVILYELLTGRTPFEDGSTEEILRRQLEEVPVPPSVARPDRRIPAALDQIVLRALHKEPEARFASAAEMRQALNAVREDKAPIRPAPEPGPGPGAKREHRDGIAAVREARAESPAGVPQSPTRLELPHPLQVPLKRAS